MPDPLVEPGANGQQLTVVLGRCHLHHQEAARIMGGQLVPLEEPADWPVEVFADGRLVARGELLTLDGSFCVRVVEVVSEQSMSRAA